MEKVPYKLLIHTNAYTGNFERELVAYAFGILDKYQENYANTFKKAFWNSVAASDIDSLEQYATLEDDPKGISNMILEMNLMEERLNKILEKKGVKEVFSDVDQEERRKRLEKDKYDKDIRRLYDYLCYTYQEVDDWEQDTFYNICSFYKNKKYNCDTIYIQLKEALPERFEKIVIERIKGFFENNAYNIIKNYDWICQFGHARQSEDDLKLLDLELVDENNKLIKKY